ncbi:hypothetical protein TPHA_0P00580 [Tetrapisispora phaffii CBS 4417]|uniref:PH domain-containing protein n=1 Tax=Tetrapisispora phaffii (strain ATCC 24235 / CBS 4417 / NBRC 1672 / NRRL Y-8282 / UCD 70-5) TaxID=1071381 RepID=G8C238_TETPH|nr:hypothetical protein TPHA_0P00580 [Tetrapisispora phaffii CBS 4417]CCE66216.1 hypothetical protein TPHA_0P00580 [Tetrapisispora phaffii CBS 4417]
MSQHNSDKHVATKAMLELKLLEVLGQSDISQLKVLFERDFNSEDSRNNKYIQDIKKSLLHYCVQVGSLELIKDVVNEFYQSDNSNELGVKLDINQQDENGNTPLHLASAQGRADVVEYLMNLPHINDCIRNKKKLQPVEVCKDLNVAQMMQLKRANYIENVIEQCKDASKKKDLSKLEQLFKNPRNKELININDVDPTTGENILHLHILHGDIPIVKWLLDHGADPFIKNQEGKTAHEVLQTLKPHEKLSLDKLNKLKSLFERKAKEKNVLEMTSPLNKCPTFKGYLKKFTNFAQGYKLRWFVLTADGKLSYYKDSSDTNNSSRGSLNLANCILHVNSTEKLKFEIVGGGAGTIKWNLKGVHPIETNKWIFVIQAAIRYQRDKKNGVIASPVSINRASTIEILGTSAGPLNQNIHNKDIDISKHELSSYKNPTSTSLATSDIKLNDNLTPQGKSYINKVIETRLEQPTDIHSFHSSIMSGESNQMKSNIIGPTDINLDDYAEGETIQDDDDDAIGLKTDPIDEDINVQYGSYGQQIAILEKSIILELNSVNKILSGGQSSVEAWTLIRKSLTSITECFTKLTETFGQRENSLVNLLDKERNVNNVWVQSVKDLEKELQQKEFRLDSLNKERKTLKKVVQQKLSKGSDSASVDVNTLDKLEDSTDPTTLEHIAKFISATRDKGEDSDADEFFDAEESVTEDEDAGSYASGARNVASHQIHEGDIIELHSATSDTHTNLADGAKVSDFKIQNFNEPSAKIEEINREATPDSKIIKEATNIPKLTDVTSTEINVDAGNTVKSKSNETSKQKESKLSGKVVKENLPEVTKIAITASQKEAESKILDELSFAGYEDGIRKRLKLDEDNRPKISLWGVLKSMVGKDMTRMTLPVSFNEPTSLLQRVTEDLEYSQLADMAATYEDSTLRMLYVAAFAGSSFASTTLRVAKPFNPLLGETYEYARPDKHYRFFTEQVSHHPPISATWTETPKWDFWGESYVDTKFTGRTFNVEHLGLWYLKLRPDCNDPTELYTWKKPKNTVIGILVGNPQVDNSGDVEITNHTTGDRAVLHFKARGWRSSGAYELRGEVFNKKGKKVWVFGGHWNDSYHAKKVTESKHSEITLSRAKTNNSMSNVEPLSDGSTFLLWKANKRPDAPFHLTPFAITLNAPQKHLVPWLAPTDTRLRPDQRAMEDGDYDLAADEKHRLEEKQRAARKSREESNTEYIPRWFKSEIHPITKKKYWNFNGEYWKLRKEHQLKDAGDIF